MTKIVRVKNNSSASAINFWRTNHLGGVLLRKAVKFCVVKLGFSYLIYPRARLAKKYLKGVGVEIGALNSPLKLPKKAMAKYIDIATREESIRKFPELNPNDIVSVDYLTDGFSLNGVPSGNFDFLIANHVLEHSPDPIGTIIQWHRVLKAGGILFCSIPNVEECFDKGRAVTDFSHLLEDFEATRNKESSIMAERNKVHYRDWLSISEPAILKRPAISEIQMQKRIDEMTVNREEVHFHTFTKSSAMNFFNKLSENLLANLRVEEIVAERSEIIVISRKL